MSHMEFSSSSNGSRKIDREAREVVSIRFAGDSGDGIQLIGDQFATIAASDGNEVVTFPDFPAEIRAPAGTVSGISGYQVNVGGEVYTMGDQIDILIAMNPAAIKANLLYLKEAGVIIANVDTFTEENIKKAGFDSNPLEGDLQLKYRVYPVHITSITRDVLKDSGLSLKEIDRCKNFFALGLICWLLNEPIDRTLKWIEKKFKNKKQFINANQKVLKAGYDCGAAKEIFTTHYFIKKKHKKPGVYRYVNGNSAVSLGLVTAAHKANRPLFVASYPITPASEIIQELSNYIRYGVKVFQAEDEISAIGAAIGASFCGHIAVTSTSGPGLCLKSEFINLAVITELPLVIIDVQRGGPSTGLPTKSEQTDLFQALWGRNGESPLVVLAARSPSDCFYTVIEATRIAVKYMTPVIVLTDGYLAMGAEALRLPNDEELLPIEPVFNILSKSEDGKFYPYIRDENTLARPWVVPGTKGFEHRIGGLEKENITGHVSYDPLNHSNMVKLRAEKILKVQQEIPQQKVIGSQNAKLLIIGWGSTYGSIRQATENLCEKGFPVASLHLKYINPLPRDLGDIISQYDKILVPENNSGQLAYILKAHYLKPVELLSKVQGLPFRIKEIELKAQEMLGDLL